jgi:hypothetical protein
MPHPSCFNVLLATPWLMFLVSFCSLTSCLESYPVGTFWICLGLTTSQSPLPVSWSLYFPSVLTQWLLLLQHYWQSLSVRTKVRSLSILLPQPPKSWDYRPVPPNLA